MRQVRSGAPEVATPRMTTRILAVFYAFGGIAGLLALLGATPHSAHSWAVAAIASGALLGAVVIGRWGPRWPRAAFHVPVAAATGLVAVAAALAPDPLTALARTSTALRRASASTGPGS
ncbi:MULTISPECIES: hypothetical protein [unclassified Modestobacter]